MTRCPTEWHSDGGTAAMHLRTQLMLNHDENLPDVRFEETKPATVGLTGEVVPL